MPGMTDLQKKLVEALPECELRFDEPMHAHTSFRIGGNAKIMAFPKDAETLGKLLNQSRLLDLKYRILGAGTNVLAPDEGIDELVICLKDCLDGMKLVGENGLQVMAGVTMTRAAVFAANHGLSGMEFAHGIPGTVGGGIYMNAGAYGGELSMICRAVDVMDENGIIHTFNNDDMQFSYRHSILEDEGGIVISATFTLEKNDPDAIRSKMKELMTKRSASQPLDMPSAGSAFKRPVGGYAAALIDEAGLKGYQVGQAAISVKHAGFAVNMGQATAADVKNLLKNVSDIVYARSGIRLEPEVRIW